VPKFGKKFYEHHRFTEAERRRLGGKRVNGVVDMKKRLVLCAIQKAPESVCKEASLKGIALIETYTFEDVVQFKMGRELNGRVLYWCSAYLVDELLIDSGCAHTAQELLAAVKGRDVEMVVNTHHHEDHTGGNALLAEELGVKLLAPAASLERIEKGYPLYDYEHLVWGRPQPSKPMVLPSKLTVSTHRFQVVPAPGHCDDHVVLWEPERGWAFAGDLLVTIRPKVCRPEENYHQILRSLKRLRELSPGVIFSGLGTIMENAVEALEQSIDYLEQMRSTISGMSAKGMTPEEIVLELFERESNLNDLTQGHYSCRNFVCSFLKDA